MPKTSAMTNLDPAPTVSVSAPAFAAGLSAIEGVEALHARSIPGTRASIDHIAIGPSGVYVIDTSNQLGPVVRRDTRLFVGTDDRSDLLAAMKVRVDAVASALGDLHLPVSRALCFVADDWPATTPAFMLKGVWVGWTNPLYRLVSQPGRLQPLDIDAAVQLLDAHLPAD
jgi:hypothetical protein